MAQPLSQAVFDQWLTLVNGTFRVRDVWGELDIGTPTGRQHLRVILNRLEHTEPAKIVKVGPDLYRKLDDNLPEINWQVANTENVVPLVLPFGIDRFCRIYPKSIIIVAGQKDNGKTAFLLKMLQLNMLTLPCDLYNSETGPEQLKLRFAPLDIPEPAPFKVYERYDNFADVIHPERWSFIDYLDTNSDVYMVGAEIDAVFRRITTGGAVIGLQKPPTTYTYVRGVKTAVSRDLAYGGAFSAKRACLYISLSDHKCKLVVVKTPPKQTVNPVNMQWSYDFDQDGYFCNIQRYYGEPPEDGHFTSYSKTKKDWVQGMDLS